MEVEIEYFTFLPPELILEIILHLPKKHVLTCKLVSKKWLNIINVHYPPFTIVFDYNSKYRYHYITNSSLGKYELIYRILFRKYESDNGLLQLPEIKGLDLCKDYDHYRFTRFIYEYNYMDRVTRYFQNKNVITNRSVSQLTSLTSLDITDYPFVTNEGIAGLTNLTKLQCNDFITNDALVNLTNLVYLSASDKITDEGIMHLTKLKKLYLPYFSKITDKPFKTLPHLKFDHY